MGVSEIAGVRERRGYANANTILGKSNKHALQALPNKQLTINTMRL